MKRPSILALLFSLSLWSSPVVAAPDVHVLAIGSNRSFSRELPDLKYAETDAQMFVEAMRTVGLVPAAQATVLTGIGVDDFRRAVEFLKASPKEGGHKNRKFIFYFSGHSDDSGLHLKDGLISKAELHEQLKAIEAHTKVAILDSCFSGAITAKGIRRSEEFELPKVEYDEPSGSVFLSASTGRQFAYESEQLRSSIFTHHLVAGLYGEADGNTDGVVTVDELYQYVYRNTKWQSLNYPTRSVQEPEYVAKLQGQGAIVLSFPARTNSKLTLGEDLQGEVTIASRKGMQFFKVQKAPGAKKTLQLPIGHYRVSILDADRVGSGEVEVEPIRIAYLGGDDIQWKPTPMASLGTVKGMQPTLEAELAEERPHRIVFGAHRGYENDARWGPMVEYGHVKRKTYSRIGVEYGGLFNFHVNETDFDGTLYKTDSSALYGICGLVFASSWRMQFSLMTGVGQTYHHQEMIEDGNAVGSQGGAAPGMLLGFGVDFATGSGRRFGIVWRQETLNLSDVRAGTSKVEGDMLGIVAAF